MTPGSFKFVMLTEHGVIYAKIMFGTHTQQQFTITVHVAQTMSSYHPWPDIVISSNACIKISKQDNSIPIWSTSKSSLKFLVEGYLGFKVSIKCGSICTD